MSAPSGNVLPEGTFAFEFQGVQLHGYATDLADDRQQRVAVHEFDRVPGGQTEWMQRAVVRLQMTLLWIDEQGFADAKDFFDRLDRGPSGLLVHPIYGRRQMTCSGTSGGRLSVQGGINVYETPVAFIENNVNGAQLAQASQGVSSKASTVDSDCADLLTFTAAL